MYEWIYAAQKLIDFIEDNATKNPSLEEISRHLGYSRFYCSVQFHCITGTTIRSYIAKRRLYMATLAVRDTNKRIIDIALEYGYSAQSVLTRAFIDAYGCTPAAYRKNPVPIPLSMSKIYISPENYMKRGEHNMNNLVEASYFIETISTHKYLGVYKRSMTKNGEIWAGHDCELTTNFVSSVKDHHEDITAHTAGWTLENGKRSYFYGVGFDIDQEIPEIPEGFELRGIFEESEYIFFTHPPFNYETENAEVMRRVEELAWNFDPTTIGYEWNEDKCQDYQYHYPEGLGYQVLRPVRKIK